MDRPTWIESYLTIAHVLAERSHDSETKVGAVITDANHIIIGTGFNGFPKGIQDCDLPTTRPGKYDWMLHAEENAVLNCSHRPTNGIAYVTTIPCFPCLKRLWQFGVTTIYYSTLYVAKSIDNKRLVLTEDLILRTKKEIKLIPVKFSSRLLQTTLDKVLSYEK
jgi:dCMP deaminase